MCTNVCLSNVYQCVPYFNVYLVHFTTIQCLRLSSPSSAAFSQAVQLLGIEIQIQKQLEDPNIFFFAVFYHLPCCCILPVSPFFLNCIVHGWLLSKFENSFSLSSKILCASWSIVNGGRILETKYKRSRLVLVFIRFGINDLPDRDFGRHSLDFLDLKLILESLPRFGSDFVQSVFISLPVRRRRCCMLETTKLFGKLCFSWLCLLFGVF